MRRRGLVIVAVLVIVALGALVAATAMHVSRSAALSASALQRAEVSRSLGLSGVQAVMAELNGQRAELLLGGKPEMSDAYVVFDDGGRRGVARLLAWPDGRLLRAEPSRLNPNKATVEMLASLPMIDEALASAIVSEREARDFESLGDLLRVSGVTPEVVWGDGAQVRASLSGERARRVGAAGEQAMGATTPLADALSVYTFEPDVQAGLGDRGREHRGNRRINLNAEWSEELGEAITARYDAGTAAGVKQIMDNDVSFEKVSDIVGVLNSFEVEPAEWVQVLDVFTTDANPYRAGLIDLNSAPLEVLAALPGVDEATAEQMISVRETLDDSRRASIAWPVVEGVVEPQAFGAMSDWVCARSLQYRVRIEAGIERGGDEGAAARSGDLERVDLEHRVVFEAVIDLAAPRPRVAFLRDLTMLASVGRMLGEREADPRPMVMLDSGLGGLSEPMTMEDLSGSLGEPAGPEEMGEAADDSEFSLSDDDGSFGASSGGGGDGGPAPASGSGGAGAANEPADNRIGRWTSG